MADDKSTLFRSWFVRGILLLAVLLFVLLLRIWLIGGSDIQIEAISTSAKLDQKTKNATRVPYRECSEEQLSRLAKTVQTWWTAPIDQNMGSGLNNEWLDPNEAVYVAARGKGKRYYQLWRRGKGSKESALRSAILSIRNKLEARSESESIDAFEIAFAHDFKKHRTADERNQLLRADHRGVRGLELRYGDKRKTFSPTWLLASNRSLQKQIRLGRDEWGLSAERAKEKLEYYSFEAEQLWVRIGEEPTAQQMERGNHFVDPSMVSRDSTEGLGKMAAEWLVNAVHQDGRLTYKYWPSSGKESDSNNMIRQWMATVALERIAKSRRDTALWDKIEKNIDYNLQQFYRQEKQLGLIEWRDKVKLGAVALAGLAILEHPKRNKWSVQQQSLRRTIDTLWQDDGSFRTFYRAPLGTKEQQNFYPGEALLYWALIYEREKDPKLLAKIMQSFAFYRNWHLNPENRNPAFIPWHTQAYAIVWRLNQDPQLAEFIFEMNDWLLSMQEWENAQYREFQGRFHDPNRPQLGPPHASATGVYLEGLIEAYRIASQLGDLKRKEKFRVVILRGIRSLMQLQFVDEIDKFYISKPELVQGGLRTTVYNNEIRCDNVQHGLMALLEILKTFSSEDFFLRDSTSSPGH